MEQSLTAMPDIANIPDVSSAVLVELQISTWTARKKDKAATAKVAREAGASAKAGNYHKNLLAGCTELEELKKFVGNARNDHYMMTAPWSDMGLRFLPTANGAFFNYINHMTGLEQEYWRLYKLFEDEYTWRISNMLAQQKELGTMFDQNEYPPVAELREKFKWKLSKQPVPESGHFSLDIPAEAMALLKQEYDDFHSAQLQGVANDIWSRLKKNLETVLRQLSPKDEFDANGNQKYNKLYDSVFDTSLSLIKMMRDFNVTGDTRMTMVADQLENALYGVNTDALKNSESLRLEKQQEVKDIIRNLPSLDI
tara:strand:- start:8281 stop:9213 length:933 start_codon:yes stop_codon:yes gene_type:complete